MFRVHLFYFSPFKFVIVFSFMRALFSSNSRFLNFSSRAQSACISSLCRRAFSRSRNSISSCSRCVCPSKIKQHIKTIAPPKKIKKRVTSANPCTVALVCNISTYLLINLIIPFWDLSTL